MVSSPTLQNISANCPCSVVLMLRFRSVMQRQRYLTAASSAKDPGSSREYLCGIGCINFSEVVLSRTLVFHAGLVLALSLNAQTSPQRYNLKPTGSHRLEHKGLEANMNVLSSCAPHNSSAGHFHKVLHYFRELIESCDEAKIASTSQIDGRGFFGTPHWPPRPSSRRDLTTSTTSPISSLWQMSSDALPWMSSFPPSLLYGFVTGPDPTVPANNNFSQLPLANYLQQSMPDATCLGWAATLPNNGSSCSLVSNSSSQPSSTDSDLEHYKPYVQDFWSTETFGFAQPPHTQGNTQSQYG